MPSWPLLYVSHVQLQAIICANADLLSINIWEQIWKFLLAKQNNYY